MAKTTDPNLVNPWGMTLGLNSGLWVSDNGAGKATTYDGTGQAIPAGSPLIVTIPGPGGMGAGTPTGVATNDTPGFVISSGSQSGPSNELFATEDGTIAGWNNSVDPTHAIIAVDNSASGAVYKGLAMGFNAAGAFLFATNFHAGTIDVFDANFHPVAMPGGFRDPKIPAGFAPFGISAINSHLYVTYAKQNAAKHDDVAGPGNGFLDIFDTQGNLLRRFISQGQLNSPWGMAWAPFQGFGDFNNALFVGNFGDGSVNAFDFDSGDFLGKVSDASGKPITISGVWGLQFGLGVAGTSSSTLFFTAGIDDEQHGLFGTLTVNPSSLPPPQGPTMTDPNLTVTTVVSGLNQPTSMTFLGAGDFLILEKASGKVQHVVNGGLTAPLQFVTPAGATLPNLPVNNASERGLLGIALDPNFTSNHLVYLYWTESSTGAVSSNLAEVGNANSPFPPGTTKPLGNRVDRFVFDAQHNTLTFDRNLIELRAFQQDNTHAIDAGQPMRGNHDAGKILFGPDGKLYVQIGDNGRRGQLQNLASGPFGPGQADDQFGGPAPDDAHVTGVIFRLNPDGTAPSDNPFANVTAAQISQLEQQAGVTLTPAQLNDVVANIHKIFSYGRRNGFGLAFDAVTGSLWESENGDDAFDEMNRITAGSNGGWVQIMGPASRVADFKQIETSFTPLQGNLPVAGNLPFSAIDPATFIPALQQLRFPPANLADTPGQALSRLFVLPGAHYDDPEFSWKWAVAPAGIGFGGSGLGAEHAGDLFVGAARTFLDGGYLFEFKFDHSRQHFAFSDPRLRDKVDDNDYKFDEGESTSLIAGKNFGIGTDIVTGPDGNLYVTSLSNGAVYMIANTSRDRFVQTNLVSDIAGVARFTDSNLVNPWGIVSAPTGPFWIADNGAGVSTVYNGAGKALPPNSPLVVTIPPPAGSAPGRQAAPTGIVFNGTSDFTVSANSNSAPAIFIFATEDGTISGWNAAVDRTNAILEVDNSAMPMAGSGAVYKGLAEGSNANGNFLFATNFRAGTIDVFDKNFAKATLAGSFTDPNLPAGFAPFGIRNIGGNLFVTFAMQDAAKHDDVAGPGNGFVDIFDTSGSLIKRFASQGMLNSPWGLALAPAQFGVFSGALLVGDFGDGRINAFDPKTGVFLGQLQNEAGAPVTINGLWGLSFGNGSNSSDANALYFTAGIADESHGLFGSLRAETANERFVAQAYLDLLHRPPDPTGLGFWSGMLAGGASRSQVVLGIEGTPEYHALVVENLYSTFLHRTADAGGLNGFTDFLGNGGAVEQVEEILISSTEYFQVRGGGTNDGFLSALYQDALKRDIDSSGQATFSQELASGTTRTQVATAILTSTEFRQDLVQADYQLFLHRAADSAGLMNFVNALNTGRRDEEIVAAIIASDEYFARL